jgi:hypothetical protein
MTEQLREDTFDEFSEGAFQGNWAVGVGFGVIRLAWFSKDDGGGGFEWRGEMRGVDGCLDDG